MQLFTRSWTLPHLSLCITEQFREAHFITHHGPHLCPVRLFTCGMFQTDFLWAFLNFLSPSCHLSWLVFGTCYFHKIQSYGLFAQNKVYQFEHDRCAQIHCQAAEDGRQGFNQQVSVKWLIDSCLPGNHSVANHNWFVALLLVRKWFWHGGIGISQHCQTIQMTVQAILMGTWKLACRSLLSLENRPHSDVVLLCHLPSSLCFLYTIIWSEVTDFQSVMWLNTNYLLWQQQIVSAVKH